MDYFDTAKKYRNKRIKKLISILINILILLIVAIIASRKLRFERVQSRARAEDGSLADLDARDVRETGWGLDRIIEESDIKFTNESNLDDFRNEVSYWLNSL